MKKINNLKLISMLFLLLIYTGINSNIAFAQYSCIPIPFECIFQDACGHTACDASYVPCEAAAAAVCVSCESACAGLLSPYACMAACWAAKTATSQGCKAVASLIQSSIIDSGVYDKAQCNEGDHCVQSSPKVNDAQFAGKCENQLSLESKKKVVRDYIGRENELLSQISANTDWGKAISDVYDEGSLFKFPFTEPGPSKFAEFIKNGYLSNKFYQAQDPALLRMEIVRQATAIANSNSPKYTLPDALLKQVVGPLASLPATKVPQEILSNNVQDPATIITTRNPDGSPVTSLGAEELKELELNKKEANLRIQSTAGKTTIKEAFIVDCKDQRVPQEIGKPNCIATIDESGRQEQSFTQIAQKNQVSVGTINVVENFLNNMFTIKGDKNLGVILQPNYFFEVHNLGFTEIYIGGNGAYISDSNKNLLYLGGGTITYRGKEFNDPDTYLGNNLIYNIKSNVAFDATKDTNGDVFAKSNFNDLSGFSTHEFANGKLATSFNHYSRPNSENAVDLAETGDGYQILTRGFADITLIGKDKFFPILNRNVLKGDSSIIFNKNVRVLNTYVARDGVYDYIIKSDEDSTKVIARNGKIIQDSGTFSYRLSKRQSLLIYNI